MPVKLNKNTWTILLLSLLLPMATVSKAQEVHIGSLYADVLNGLTFIQNDEAAFLLRIGWVDDEGNYDNKKIWDHGLRYGLAASDGSYTEVNWKVDDTRITFTWSRQDQTAVVGKISVDKPIRLALQTSPSWDNFYSWYRLADKGMTGSGYRAGNLRDKKADWFLQSNLEPDHHFCISSQTTPACAEDVAKYTANGINRDFGKGTHASLIFDLTPKQPLTFTAGLGQHRILQGNVNSLIRQAKERYEKERAQAKGKWGDFVGPILSALNHNKVYNFQTGRVCHTITRSWCNTDGMILFEWDSYFNALLASLEDPGGAKETIRGLLDMQQENGLLPSYYGVRWGVSWDRSQPPVGAMCVWKIHQRWPDKAFLKEIYPALKKHHDWWMAERPENELPYRDGNQNGLLEWGSENDPQHILAAYESGLDDSPMWDNVVMNAHTRTLELDAVGLSALWGMDAMYLSKIAEALNKDRDARRFEREANQMRQHLNDELWNEQMGLYNNKLWNKNSIEGIQMTHTLPKSSLRLENGTQGVRAQFMDPAPGKILLDTVVSDIHLSDYNLDQIFGETETREMRFSGKITPPKPGKWQITASSLGRVRLKIAGNTVIDRWNLHWRRVDTTARIFFPEEGLDYTLIYQPRERWKEMKLGMREKNSYITQGRFYTRLAPTLFYPMILEAPGQGKASRMMDILLDEKYFWGQYVIPSISRNDPAFPKQHYWRGKIWAPTNYLTYLGLKNYLNPEDRLAYARKSVELFMKNWKRTGGSHENFLVSGQGSSRPYYTWGTLMLLIGLEEMEMRQNDQKKDETTGKPIRLLNIPQNGKKENFSISVDE